MLAPKNITTHSLCQGSGQLSHTAVQHWHEDTTFFFTISRLFHSILDCDHLKKKWTSKREIERQEFERRRCERYWKWNREDQQIKVQCSLLVVCDSLVSSTGCNWFLLGYSCWLDTITWLYNGLGSYSTLWGLKPCWIEFLIGWKIRCALENSLNLALNKQRSWEMRSRMFQK